MSSVFRHTHIGSSPAKALLSFCVSPSLGIDALFCTCYSFHEKGEHFFFPFPWYNVCWFLMSLELVILWIIHACLFSSLFMAVNILTVSCVNTELASILKSCLFGGQEVAWERRGSGRSWLRKKVEILHIINASHPLSYPLVPKRMVSGLHWHRALSSWPWWLRVVALDADYLSSNSRSTCVTLS